MKKQLLTYHLFVPILILLASSCKVAQKPSSPTSIPAAQKQDTVVVDTLKHPDQVRLPDSVELKVHRVIKDTLTLIGVGDIMMGTNYPETYYLPPNEGKQLFDEVDTILQNADVTFGNLEGVILDEGGDPKYCKNPKLCYIFRSPEAIAQNFVDAGFDVMSTANNHAGDFGDPGRANTMRVLDSLGIYHAGLQTKPFEIFMIDGMKYGFAAFAPNTGTMSINDHAKAKAIINHLDTLTDVVIVSFHGGAEGSKHEHVTRDNEYFYGENRGDVYHFAHDMIDAGADVIFGHGPHVTRALEVYKKRFIAYSLGNFCTYARFNLRGVNGLAPIVKIWTNSQGEFIQGHITPIVQRPPGGPAIDHNKRVIFKIRELTEKDFPQSVITIDERGFINYIQD